MQAFVCMVVCHKGKRKLGYIDASDIWSFVNIE